MFINQENVQCMSPKCVPRRCFSFLCISPAGVCVSYVGRSCQEGFWRQAEVQALGLAFLWTTGKSVPPSSLLQLNRE